MRLVFLALLSFLLVGSVALAIEAELVTDGKVDLDEPEGFGLILVNDEAGAVSVEEALRDFRLIAIDTAGAAATLRPRLAPSFVEQLRDKPVRISPGGRLEIPLELPAGQLRRAGIHEGRYSVFVVLTPPVQASVQGTTPGARWDTQGRTAVRVEIRSRAKPKGSPSPFPISTPAAKPTKD